jgi:hypothetical protein
MWLRGNQIRISWSVTVDCTNSAKTDNLAEFMLTFTVIPRSFIAGSLTPRVALPPREMQKNIEDLICNDIIIEGRLTFLLSQKLKRVCGGGGGNVENRKVKVWW